jgi:uncharacterized protein YggU (UPF0235/DUF167 family)
LTRYWHPLDDGVSVTVKVLPKSRRPGVQGQALYARGPGLRIGVSEPPEDGLANKAVCAVLAKDLRVPASTVAVMLGQTSRDKTLHIAGDTSVLAARLATL